LAQGDFKTDVQAEAVAEECTRRSEDDTLSFPDQLGLLAETRIEAYLVDFRRSMRTYYLVDGSTIETPLAR
jgi:hypothetical protein